jgi:two-component system cell cycle sensor histidine kinase/response regulator CckA
MLYFIIGSKNDGPRPVRVTPLRLRVPNWAISASEALSYKRLCYIHYCQPVATVGLNLFPEVHLCAAFLYRGPKRKTPMSKTGKPRPARPIHSNVDSLQRAQLFQVVAEAATDAIITIDERSTILFVNETTERIFGYPVSKMMGREVTMLMPDYLRETHKRAVERYLETGSKHISWTAIKMTGLHSSGTEIPLEVSLGEHVQGKRRIFTGIVRDVSEREQSEALLRQSEAKYASMVHSSPDAITLRSLPDRRYIEVNEGFSKLTGYSTQEVLGKTPAELNLWVEPESHRATLQRLETEGRVSGDEFRFRTKSGEIRYGRASAVRVTVNGQTCMLSVTHDITDRKRTETALSQLASIVESSDDAIVGKALDGTIVSWNGGAERIYGYSASEVIGKPVSILLPSDQQDELPQILEKIRRDERIQHYETIRIRKNGQRINISVTISPVKDAEGMVVGASAIARDITERKRVAEKLQESESHFRSLVHDAPYGIYRITLDGRLLQVNPALVKMLGYESESELMRCDAEKDICADPETHQRLITNYWRKQDFRDVEAQWRRKDGKIITVKMTGHPVLEKADSPAYFEVFGEDITERRSLERQLLQSQKMEAIGRLAGGVAHDFNNLLGVILGHSDILDQQIGADGRLRKSVEATRQAAERAAALTMQLLAFSRKQVIEPTVIDLNASVLEIEKMLHRVIGEDIELAIRPQPGLWRVKADPGQLSQVLMNLAINSRDAMPGGGKLVIETANVELDTVYGRQHLGAKPGPHVMLAVSDTGIGMDSETLSHIFEPFFTTKETGKGTGLGLSMVYGIVKQSNGYIMAYSEPGRGTTFKIYFPRTEESAPLPRKEEEEILRGTEAVLVVEDEPALRELTCILLEDAGYKVLDSSGVEEALEMAKDLQRKIDLLLTDIVMPRMDGRELANQMLSLRPDLKVLFMSGYTDDVIVHRGALTQGTMLVQKPFTKRTLLRKVRETLDSQAQILSSENR